MGEVHKPLIEEMKAFQEQMEGSVGYMQAAHDLRKALRDHRITLNPGTGPTEYVSVKDIDAVAEKLLGGDANTPE